MKILYAMLLAVALSPALECGSVISMEQAINNAKQYVGTVQSSQLYHTLFSFLSFLLLVR